MRVTEKKLRQLIREAISGSDPQSLYDRKLEIEKQYGSYVLLLSRIGEEDYKAIYDMREQMYEADSSRSGYAKFQPQTKREYSVFASLADKKIDVTYKKTISEDKHEILHRPFKWISNGIFINKKVSPLGVYFLRLYDPFQQHWFVM